MKLFNVLILIVGFIVNVSCSKVQNVEPNGGVLTAVSNKNAAIVYSVPTTSVTVKVTTYNILSKNYDSKFPNNIWADRKDAVKAIIKQSDNVPEILGIQEGQNIEQVNALILRMGTDYDNYVSPLDISARAIFWKNDKYELLASDTKDIMGGSITGYLPYRYASYVRLKHIATGKSLIVFNIHLPAGGGDTLQEVRHIAANIVASKVQNFSSDFGNVPVIVMGDFNGYYNTVISGFPSAGATLTSHGLVDTYSACAVADRLNANYSTKNNMVDAKAVNGTSGSKRLDYIFTYPLNGASVLDWRNIINFSSGSTIDMEVPVPSDHNPVRSRLTLYWYN